MNRYKLIGIAAAAVTAAVCFYAYYSGGEEFYGIALILASASFAVTGWSEVMVTKRDGGALSYMKPALFFVLALLTLAAAIWFFISRS